MSKIHVPSIPNFKLVKLGIKHLGTYTFFATKYIFVLQHIVRETGLIVCMCVIVIVKEYLKMNCAAVVVDPHAANNCFSLGFV